MNTEFITFEEPKEDLSVEKLFQQKLIKYKEIKKNLLDLRTGNEIIVLIDHLITCHQVLRSGKNKIICCLKKKIDDINNYSEKAENIEDEAFDEKIFCLNNKIYDLNNYSESVDKSGYQLEDSEDQIDVKKLINLKLIYYQNMTSLTNNEFLKELEDLKDDLLERNKILRDVEMKKINFLKNKFENLKKRKKDEFSQILENYFKQKKEFFENQEILKKRNENQMKLELELVTKPEENLENDKIIYLVNKENEENNDFISKKEEEIDFVREDINTNTENIAISNLITINNTKDYYDDEHHVKWDDIKHSIDISATFIDINSFHIYYKCNINFNSYYNSALVACKKLHLFCKYCIKNYITLKHSKAMNELLFDKFICPICVEESIAEESHDSLRNIFGEEYVNKLMEKDL